MSPIFLFESGSPLWMFVIFGDMTPTNLVDSHQWTRSHIPGYRDSLWNIFHPSASMCVSSKWSIPFRFVLYTRMSLVWPTLCPSHLPPFHQHLLSSKSRETRPFYNQVSQIIAFLHLSLNRYSTHHTAPEKRRSILRRKNFALWCNKRNVTIHSVDIKHSWN
jgi:hypothetical protein